MHKQSDCDPVEREAQKQGKVRPRGHSVGNHEDVLTLKQGLNEGSGFQKQRQGEALPATGNSSTSIWPHYRVLPREPGIVRLTSWPRIFITTRLTFHVESKPVKENRPEQESQTTFRMTYISCNREKHVHYTLIIHFEKASTTYVTSLRSVLYCGHLAVTASLRNSLDT